jgi:peptidyl-prolyl cis-trans isomerase C
MIPRFGAQAPTCEEIYMTRASWFETGLLIAVLASGLTLGACRRASGPPPPPPAGSATPSTAPSSAPVTPPPAPAGSAATGASAAPSLGAPAAAAPSPQPAKPVPQTLPAIVAKVGEESIEAWELESAVKQAEVNAGKPVPPEQRDAVMRSVLDELVTYHMFARESRAQKIAVTDAELDAQIKMIRDMFPTEEAFKQALASRGLTPERLRAQERRGLEAQKVLQARVESKVSVQDKDVEDFYKQNIDKFKQGETVHASHIFIAVPQGASAEQKNQARAKAQQVLSELKAGADFAEAAKKYSDDATGPDGGDLGFFGKGDLPPDFESVAYGLKPGTISGVVELGAGFHIVKVFERRAPRTIPLVEARDQVKAFLGQTQRQNFYQQFLDEVKARTKIEILV